VVVFTSPNQLIGASRAVESGSARSVPQRDVTGFDGANHDHNCSGLAVTGRSSDNQQHHDSDKRRGNHDAGHGRERD